MTSIKLGRFSVVKPEKNGLLAEQVVIQVRDMIRQGKLRPGDRLPSERELAKRLGISRASLRPGFRFLAAMGVLTSRHGSGTYIADGPPALDSEPLRMLAALHGFTQDEMFEARRLLEVGLAGLAAEHATDDHLATMAEEVTEMYATLDDPQQYLIHDIRFHRAIAAGSGNQILAALMDMVSAVMYERRSATVERATDLKESAEMHRKIYRLIRGRKADEARVAMSEHLTLAQRAFASEEVSGMGPFELQAAKSDASNGKVSLPAKRERAPAGSQRKI
ncbi:MAG TPA: FadR/GntR family transcriptional regulator [Pyrinomonadaceae bacterium]|nr:FadR/GntR family transcriptional regulator [Pyrinomonadaceae bacterium]